jgi:hypothetical protein
LIAQVAGKRLYADVPPLRPELALRKSIAKVAIFWREQPIALRVDFRPSGHSVALKVISAEIAYPPGVPSAYEEVQYEA